MKWLPTAGITDLRFKIKTLTGKHELTGKKMCIRDRDTTVQSWGLGSHTDADNRPNAAVSAQQKYGDYHALFIGENTKTIYLTFDEGYEYGYTESILDTLKEKGVHAVFFVTEPYAKAEPALVQRMIDEGHVVGNHSVTHPSAGIPSLTVEQQQEEVMGNHQYIKDTFGYEMNLFRYPAGKFSEQSLAVVTVSYTHLDVYKRQVRNRVCTVFPGMLADQYAGGTSGKEME